MYEDAIHDYGQLASEPENHAAPTRWAWVSLLIEVKTASSQCPFAFDWKTRKSGKAASDKASSNKTSSEEASPDKASAEKLSSDIVAAQEPERHGKASCPSPRSDDPPSGAVSKLRDEGNSQSDSKALDARSTKGNTQTHFLRLHAGGKRTLGQMTEYVSKLFRRQHRTHCFTLFVYNGQARIIRWDRAGAVVSTPINFAKDPTLFHQLVWRYACMNQVQRGFDPTVVRATRQETRAMRDCQAPSDWADRYRNGAIDQPGWPMYKITLRREDLVDEAELQPLAEDMEPSQCTSVPVDDAPTFIVGKVYFASDSVTGRSTKCYIAYEVSRNRLVFLKDYWRPTSDTLSSEGDVLKELRTGGVRFVPTPVATGDVYSDAATSPQTSCTQFWLPKDVHTTLDHVPLTHNRLVTKEIGYPLEDHQDAFDLVLALYYAMRGKHFVALCYWYRR